jgi:DNA-binding LacI/PurR family transcriptional regulator
MSTKTINSNSSTPIAFQLRALLLEEIEGGVYAPGERFPSERDLSKKYGISRTSVREAIAQLLSEGTLFRTVGRGTYVAEDIKKRKLKADGTRQVGFWIGSDIFNFVQPGYNQILAGVGEFCQKRGYGLQFHVVDEGQQGVDNLISEDAVSGGLDGHLVIGGVNQRVMERLRELNKPIMLVDLLMEDDDADSVRIDYASGIRQAVEHLKALGHEEIGFIGFAGSQKHEAFWQSLEACGLPYHPRHTKFLSSPNLLPGMLAGYRAMQKLIAAGPLPTAVLVTNDYVTQGVLEALAVEGTAVPEAISVIGCDDLHLGAQRLTTIQVDLMEVGRIAASALLDRIETGAELESPVVVPVKLVVRGTTAPPRAASPDAETASAARDANPS